MYPAGTGMRQAVSHAAPVADNIQAGISSFQVFIQFHFHIVKLDLHTVQQRIVVGCAGSNFVQRVDHLDNTVQNPFRNDQAQISGSCGKGRRHKGIRNTSGGTSASADQISEALYDHTAAQHVAQPGNGLTVSVGILERFGKMLADQQGKVRIVRMFRRIFITVSVDRYNTVGILR